MKATGFLTFLIVLTVLSIGFSEVGAAKVVSVIRGGVPIVQGSTRTVAYADLDYLTMPIVASFTVELLEPSDEAVSRLVSALERSCASWRAGATAFGDNEEIPRIGEAREIVSGPFMLGEIELDAKILVVRQSSILIIYFAASAPGVLDAPSWESPFFDMIEEIMERGPTLPFEWMILPRDLPTADYTNVSDEFKAEGDDPTSIFGGCE